MTNQKATWIALFIGYYSQPNFITMEILIANIKDILIIAIKISINQAIMETFIKAASLFQIFQDNHIIKTILT